MRFRLMRHMIWIVCGIKAVKHENMNINIVGVVKRCAHYMQKNCMGFMVILEKDERLRL